MKPSILIVDDKPAMRELIAAILEPKGIACSQAESSETALSQISERDFDVVLTDVRMPGPSGISLCGDVVQRRPGLPVIVMTAFGSMETAVDALRAGAYDFVTKPFENDLLVAAIQRAVSHSQLSRTIRHLRDVARSSPPKDLLGQSPPMLHLMRQLGPIAASDASVLITGESGTGKELVARTIHQNSSRSGGPFVGINCAALSQTLLESELFGHAKGAFTDANRDREGLFASAGGGTLLLDEMGDMPMSVQVKLLRALEEQKVRPVGCNTEVPFDVRVLSATHRDLESAVEEGTFRSDLFYRINVINVDLPPLRARGTDILLIADHYILRFAQKSGREVDGITRAAAAKLLGYSWPGNIRELRNVIERGVALSTTNQLGIEDLPPKVVEHRSTDVFIGGDDPSQLVPLEQIQQRYIEHVLAATGGNRTRAAEILGLDRKTLYRRLKDNGGQDGGE